MHMVEPILVSLGAFNGKQPCMGRAWFFMKTLMRHVLSLRDPPFELPSSLVDVIENQFYQRWRMLMIDIHYVGALLNPYFLVKVRMHDDANVKEMSNKIVQKQLIPQPPMLKF